MATSVPLPAKKHTLQGVALCLLSRPSIHLATKKNQLMGEEEKKPEEKKKEEHKAEKKMPPEIVLRVFMHCEGCAKKVRRCLKGFEGVEEVITDCKGSRVVVRGEKADPAKVLERVQRKSHRRVELISPLPAQKEVVDVVLVKPQEDKHEGGGGGGGVITMVLGVFMHCEACAQEIEKRIQRIKGVESAEADLKSSQVRVKGELEPQNLIDFVFKRTGKHATIIKVDPDNKNEEEKPKPQPEKKEEEPIKSGQENGEPAAVEEPKTEIKKAEMYYYYPQNIQLDHQRFVQDINSYSYPPQMFSDENPNACCVV